MIDQFWQEYLATNKLSDLQYQEAFQFGAEPDHLLDLVIKQHKRATSSLFDLYKRYEQRVPTVGDYYILLDSLRKPQAVVQITAVELLQFGSMTQMQTELEGEGSYDQWLEAHKKFFNSQLEGTELNLNAETQIVFEQFKCVYHK